MSFKNTFLENIFLVIYFLVTLRPRKSYTAVTGGIQNTHLKTCTTGNRYNW